MRTFAVIAGAALAFAVGSVGAQTLTYDLNKSITKAQPVVATTCAATPARVVCPGDTKTQFHWLKSSAANSVFVGFDSTVTTSAGLEIAPGGKQAWDVAGGIVYCAASTNTTLYTLCGR